MVSRSEAGNVIVGHGNSATKAIAQSQSKRFDKSYGAMTTIMGYLNRIESVKLQGLDTWWYVIGVARVQTLFELSPKMFYFNNGKEQITAVSETGKILRLRRRG